MNEVEFNEIIALQVNGEIYFGSTAIETCRNVGTCDRIYSRGVFRLIGAIDDEPAFIEYADNAPTLFLRSELEEFNNGL